MAISYKKLWKLLIDKDMKKKDLCALSGISHASMAKLGKNENVTTDVLVKICSALHCNIGDIMEIEPESISDKIPTLSLFSGAGGLDIGFHKAGFDIVGCVEIEKQYCETLIANRNNGKYFNPNAKVFCGDIKLFDASEYASMGIECVIGGPPCQPFSAAGRRSGGAPGMLDDRGKLFESYCNVLRVLKPKVFIFENVYGITGANNGKAWEEINSSFASLGYKVSAEILDAADYGVAQHRERLILVGSLDDAFIFPEPTHGPDSNTGKRLVSILDVIKDLQNDEDMSENVGGMYGHLLPLVPEGLNYSFFTKEMGYPEPYFAWRSKFHDFLYKADRNRPSRTLKAQPGKFTGPFHWNNRHFTIDELKRIQSFPDDYVITGTDTQIIAQIGNSVPPQLAQVLAISVKEQLLRKQENLTFPTRKEGFKSTFRKRQRETTEYYKKIAKAEIEKRFGKSIEATKCELTFSKAYSIGYENKYHERILINENDWGIVNDTLSKFKVNSNCKSEHLNIDVEEIVSSSSFSVKIYINGLKKYLIKIDSLSMNAAISSVDKLFEIWNIIQKELIDMSQFYSLIDIYGHYANRGDTVNIVTTLSSTDNSSIIAALNFFGDSNNCGIYHSRSDISHALNIELEEIDDLISQLRNLRFDVRSSKTHPTITTDKIICTYPFPMLSERVLFDKKGIDIVV